jgi:hypothetical protein
LVLGVTPQAQDLLIPLVDGPAFLVVSFFILHFLFWAMPVHYSGRILINDDARLFAHGRQFPSPYFDWLERWIPRLLGAATFVAVIVSAYRARINLPLLGDDNKGVTDSISRSLLYFMIWCVLAMIVFLFYAAYRDVLAKGVGSERANKVAAKARPLLNVLDIGRQRSAAPLKADVPYDNALGQLVLIFVFLFFILVLLADANLVAEALPRAFAVTFMLGGWVPVLTYLSAIGRRLQAPLIIATMAAITLLTVLLGDNHDVRLIETSAGSASDAQQGRLKIDEALTMWMDANGCPNAPQNCPRPIIVVAAGGASRAGFFTSSVLGEFIDKAADHRMEAAQLRNRLFAISSVSGSSVAAVTAVAAMAAGGSDMRLPCPAKPFSLWYGDEIKNWRGCLESLMAGDFLTPTFIGLTFHDMIPFGPWPDRATLIERSWERIFTKAMKSGLGNGNKLSCPADLECPFFTLRPTSKLWLPLLVLNGVSVDTGQRVVTTLLDRTYHAADKCPSDFPATDCPLFTETWFFHDLLRHPSQSSGLRSNFQRFVRGDYWFGRANNDVRLSTAADNSARFPIVSPPGSIRNQNYDAVDRIVDGGYIDDYGVLSAFELVKAVIAAKPGLIPFVLVISNDPADPIDLRELPDNVHDTDFLTDLTGLIASVARTRNARATLSVVQLRDFLFTSIPKTCEASFAHIRVWPQRENVNGKCEASNLSKKPLSISLSWWLSTPRQYRLFEEIEDKNTCNQKDLETVWKALSMNSGCAKN